MSNAPSNWGTRAEQLRCPVAALEAQTQALLFCGGLRQEDLGFERPGDPFPQAAVSGSMTASFCGTQ